MVGTFSVPSWKVPRTRRRKRRRLRGQCWPTLRTMPLDVLIEALEYWSEESFRSVESPESNQYFLKPQTGQSLTDKFRSSHTIDQHHLSHPSTKTETHLTRSKKDIKYKSLPPHQPSPSPTPNLSSIKVSDARHPRDKPRINLPNQFLLQQCIFFPTHRSELSR